MKNLTKLFVVLVVLVSSFSNANVAKADEPYSGLTTLEVSPDSCFAGLAHYHHLLPEGNQTWAGASVDDPFAYNPNDPMSAYPNQSWMRYPEYSYMFLYEPKTKGRDHKLLDFPDPSQDSTFVSMTFEIPEGKQIRYIDAWAIGTDENWASDLVFMLHNDETKWCAEPLVLNKYSDPEKGFTRFDVQELGITDNLNKTATQFTVCRRDRRHRFRIAEYRFALEDNPNAGDNTKPEFSDVTEEVVENLDISAVCNEVASVYLVPAGTPADFKSILDALIMKKGVTPGEKFSFSTKQMEVGEYVLYALDGNNNLSEASAVIKVIADVVAPVISKINTDAYPQTSWVPFDCDEEGRAFLVPEGTTADSASIAAAAVYELGVDSGTYYLQTGMITARTYVVHAIDLVGNISVASDIITIEALPEYKNLEEIVALSNLEIDAANYGDVYNLAEYAVNDEFVYDPANPTASTPYNGWDKSVPTTSCFIKGGRKWECDFEVSEGKELLALDLWGREYKGVPGETDKVEDGSWDGQRTQDLMLYLRNADSTVTWETPVKWKGVSDPSEGAYGRFVFKTKDIPAEILKNGGHLTIHKPGNNHLHISELRLVEADKYNTAPVANAGPAQTVEPGATVTLDASASTDVDGDDLTYTWTSMTDRTIVLDAVEKPTFTAPTAEGDYQFSLTVSDGDKRSARSMVTITVEAGSAIIGVEALGLNVYPNPSNEGFTVDMSMMTGASLVSIFDICGKLVYQNNVLSNETFELGAEVLTQGAYFLSIKNDDKNYLEKLIVR